MKANSLFLIAASAWNFASAVLGQTNATMTDVGPATPPPGPYDVVQTVCTYCTSAPGTFDGPDGLNYYTDNGPNHGFWAGQTFSTGTNAAGYNLTSVTIHSGGINHSSDYATPQLYHLYFYSVSGSTATLLAHFTNYSTFTDGDWVQWNLGTNTVALTANSAYAYGFGRGTNGTGWAGLGNASGNPFPGGELALLPTSGGTITFGSSHNYDATFEIGLTAVGAPTVVVSANPPYGLTGQSFTITAAVTPGVGTVTNVTVNLGAIGGPTAASLVLSNANVYTNTFSVPAGAPPGPAHLTATATDTTPMAGAGDVIFTVLGLQTVAVDLTKTFQTIEGLGGATVFYAGWLTAHPYKLEIYTNAFAGLNLSMLRLGDWYSYQTPLAGFDASGSEIVANANRILGHPVQVYMSSWSPPAFLKNNGQYGNGSLLYTNGAFVYPGFAQYWYDSINAYRSNSISPTWISIQNEPDFSASYGSCLLEPAEQGTNNASYPKALDAVYQRITNLPSPPKLLAPECVHFSFNDLANYAAAMNTNHYYGIAHHLYGDSLDPATLGSVTNIIPGKPRFMTEFGLSDMIDQATLLHNELVFEQVCGYNYWSLVWPAGGNGLINQENPWSAPSTWTNAPPGIPEPHGWWLTPAYWAMKHFSYFINPGYKRLGATNSDNNVLSSAYLSPDQLRLIVVLINTSATLPSTMAVNYGAFGTNRTSVYQTAGTNTWQSLGALASWETLPPRSLTTLVVDKIITVAAAGNPSPSDEASGVALNASLSWTRGTNAEAQSVYFGTSSNAVAQATPTAPEFQGNYTATNFSPVLLPRTNYFWRVDESAGANTNTGVVWSFATAPAQPLPLPWQSQDIGSVGVAGSAFYNNGVFAVTGAGADIQGTADAFRFVYVPVTNDCTIIARVSSEQNVNPWSKAGVMIRESLAAGAVNAFVAVTPANGVTWQYRSTTGGGTSWNNTGGPNAPYWLMLVRGGNTFTGYCSPDGTNWTQQGTATFTMAANALVGLGVTSHNSSSLGLATFDNVTAPLVPPNLHISLTTSNLVFSWPVTYAGFTLQSSTNLAAGSWMTISSPAPQSIGTNFQITLTATNAVQFFRLLK